MSVRLLKRDSRPINKGDDEKAKQEERKRDRQSGEWKGGVSGWGERRGAITH